MTKNRTSLLALVLVAFFAGADYVAGQVTYYFNWYCSGCASIGARTTGTEGPFSSRPACEAAREAMQRNMARQGGGVRTVACQSTGFEREAPPSIDDEPRPTRPRPTSPNPPRENPIVRDDVRERTAREARAAREAEEKRRADEAERNVEAEKQRVLESLKDIGANPAKPGLQDAGLGLKGATEGLRLRGSQPPAPPERGSLTRIGLRCALSEREARDWLKAVEPWLTEASGPFPYLDPDLLGAWVLWDWATDRDSIRSDIFEKQLGVASITAPTLIAVAALFGKDPSEELRAEGLGITNLRPSELLAETNAAQRLSSSDKVPADIRSLADAAIRDKTQTKYRELLLNNKRFSLFVLAATMQVLHERLRDAEVRVRQSGLLKGLTIDKERYELLVSYAIEHNRGSMKEIIGLIESLHPQRPKQEGTVPYHRMHAFPSDFWRKGLVPCVW